MKTLLAYLIAAPILITTALLIGLTVAITVPVIWAFSFLAEGDDG